MSTIDFALLLNGVDHSANLPAVSPLRLVLVQGEALRLPRSRTSIRVLAGSAWITQDGEDRFLLPGEAMTAAAGRDGVVISALGARPLLLEMR